MRAPSDTTNGTGSSKGTSHSKGQRSSSSTYHRQRRHSDFCEYGPHMPSHAVLGPEASDLPYIGVVWLTGNGNLCSSQLQRREEFCIKMQRHYRGPGGGNTQDQEGIRNWKSSQSRCCFLLPLYSPGFPFLLLISCYLFPNLSVLETSPNDSWNPFGPLIRDRALTSGSTWD